LSGQPLELVVVKTPARKPAMQFMLTIKLKA